MWFEVQSIIEAIVTFWASALCVAKNNHTAAQVFAAFGVFFVICYAISKWFSAKTMEQDISDLEERLRKLEDKLKEKNK